MSDDPIAALAVGLAEDHKADKRRRARKTTDGETGQAEGGQETAEGGAPLEPVEGDGVTELREAVAELGDTLDEAEEVTYPIAARIEAMAETAVLDTRTLVGDLRDTFLDMFRTRPKPWSQMTEDEQRQVIIALEQASRHLVTQAVQLVSAAGDGSFTAKLEKYADGGGLKIALTAESTTDNVLACHAAQGQYVTVARYDPKPFSGERRAPTIEPDEPEMLFEGDQGDPPVTPPGDDSDLNPFGDDKDPPADADDEQGGDAGSEG